MGDKILNTLQIESVYIVWLKRFTVPAIGTKSLV